MYIIAQHITQDLSKLQQITVICEKRDRENNIIYHLISLKQLNYQINCMKSRQTLDRRITTDLEHSSPYLI